MQSEQTSPRFYTAAHDSNPGPLSWGSKVLPTTPLLQYTFSRCEPSHFILPHHISFFTNCNTKWLLYTSVRKLLLSNTISSKIIIPPHKQRASNDYHFLGQNNRWYYLESLTSDLRPLTFSLGCQVGRESTPLPKQTCRKNNFLSYL